MNMMPPRQLVSSLPPPPGNVAVAAWYRAGKALDMLADLETRLWLALSKYANDMQSHGRELEDLARQVRDARRTARKSHDDLKEFVEEQETSQVRDLKDQLAAAQALVKEKERHEQLLSEAQEKARVEARQKWEKRVWGLVSAMILMVAGWAIRELTRR